MQDKIIKFIWICKCHSFPYHSVCWSLKCFVHACRTKSIPPQRTIIYLKFTITANKIYACDLCDGRYSVPHQYTKPHFHTIFAVPVKLSGTSHGRVNIYGALLLAQSKALHYCCVVDFSTKASNVESVSMWWQHHVPSNNRSNICMEDLHGGSIYRKSSSIKRTQTQNLNFSRLVLQLSLPNPLKSCAKSRMKM